jgi:DNA-binding protein H-NS
MPRSDDVDLDALTIPELDALAKRIERTIAAKRDTAKRALRERIEKLAAQEGFTLPELVAGGAKRTRAKVKAKYANPKNPAQTWAGRGKQPAWVRDALAAGTSLADLAV